MSFRHDDCSLLLMGAIEKVHQLRQDPFLLMSGKCNKGHGEGVAGMTTLLKILFFIQDQHVPPQIHFNRLNPHIDAGRVPMLFCGESFALLNPYHQRH
eukprot:s202_g11.t9